MARPAGRVGVLHYDAFTLAPDRGNPAGIVLDADGLGEARMQAIAARVGFNETAFVLASSRADLRLRFFTPGHEMDLCGHGTVATVAALLDHGRLTPGHAITVETAVGVLDVAISAETPWRIAMRQSAPEFLPFAGDPAALADALGVAAGDLDPARPIVYGSTGTWTLLVPVQTLDAFTRMQPANARFPALLAARPRASVHPFTLQTVDPQCHVHARHFSSPYSGTVEDPVTGTASGVLGAYWLAYLHPERPRAHLIVEQGLELGRNGRVIVDAERTPGGVTVRITGTAVFVRDLRIE